LLSGKQVRQDGFFQQQRDRRDLLQGLQVRHPERKYEWKGFVSQSMKLNCKSWNGIGKLLEDPTAFLVKIAQEKARGMNANAIIDVTLKDVLHFEESVYNRSTGTNDKVVTIIREFYGIAVRFV
jgi:hypothetical protein